MREPGYAINEVVIFENLTTHAGIVVGISTEIGGWRAVNNRYKVRLLCDDSPTLVDECYLYPEDSCMVDLTCDRCEWELMEHKIKEHNVKR